MSQFFIIATCLGLCIARYYASLVGKKTALIALGLK